MEKRVLVGIMLVLSILAASNALAATIHVSQPLYLTNNNNYDRNPSISKGPTNYFVFYTKANGHNGTRTGTEFDSYDYTIYFKLAPTIEGLATAPETKLAKSASKRPTGFSQRVASGIIFSGSKRLVIASSGQDGTDRHVYTYAYNSGWSDPTQIVTSPETLGGHVRTFYDGSKIYLVMESTDAKSYIITSSDQGVTWTNPTLISEDNQPAITKFGTELYVVSIGDEVGNPIKLHKSTDGGSTWSFVTNINGLEGNYDPNIFVHNSELYVVSAPYNLGNDWQYIMIAKSSDNGATWSTKRMVTNGGYGTNYWWDYWPVGYSIGADAYIFYTTEKDGINKGDAEIAALKLDWDTNDDHFEAIQPAVDAAVSDDTVQVAAGTYNEVVTIAKPLTLNGAQADVDARTRSGAESLITSTDVSGTVKIGPAAGTVTVNGFDIYGIPTAYWGGAIWVLDETDNAIVKNNIIEPSVYSDGILLWYAKEGRIENNLVKGAGLSGITGGKDTELKSKLVITNNKIEDSEYGVTGYLDHSTISDNEIIGTGALAHGAGIAGQFFNTLIEGNTVQGYSDGTGIAFWDYIPDGGEPRGMSDITVRGNTFNNNKVGVYVAYDLTGKNIVVSGQNNFANSENVRFYTTGLGTLYARHNYWNNIPPLGMPADVLYTPWLCDLAPTTKESSTYYRDADVDTYGDPAVSTEACSQPTGYVLDNTDCNDNNAAFKPGATEVCNGIDDNCNGQIDEGLLITYYRDADSDGYGDPLVTTQACSAPSGYVTDNTDCDDTNNQIHPGTTEICNDVDDNCNNAIDEENAPGCIAYYLDMDKDTYGVDQSKCLCAGSGDYIATRNGDCNDADANIHPGATEICNGIDDDCNGLVDDGLTAPTQSCTIGVGACATTGTQSKTCNGISGWSEYGACSATAGTPSTETCNGIDDDCNELVDDGLTAPTQACTVGIGACSSTGTQVKTCNGVSGWSEYGACSATAGTPTDEVCNNVDDDCDGNVDNNIAPIPSDNIQGLCSGNVKVCQGGNFVDRGNNYVPTSETCNGLDDNCDGFVDEDIAPIPSDNTQGLCSSNVKVCEGGNLVDSENNYVSALETCNGFDDDCNGLVDDQYVPLPTSCGVGACASTGSTSCVSGLVVDSCTHGTPATEICNGIDDDCNGLIDEGLTAPTQACTVGIGACATTGTQVKTCNGVSGWSEYGACSATAGTPGTEICNGIDEDCDGSVDNNIAPIPSDNIQGLCSGNVKICEGGNFVDSENNYVPTPETCNGFDDDCNGLVDDGLTAPTQSCTVGIGACASTGTQSKTCDGVSGWSEYGACSATAGTPGQEICNGIDDNCNGLVDDGLTVPTQSCTVGIGACASTGTQVKTCNGISGWSEYGACSATAGTPSQEICNGIDDDCNGLVDDQYVPLPTSCGVGACANTGSTSCISGSVVDSCTHGTPTTEICNGIDDNCDGQVDEGVKTTFYKDGDGDGYGGPLVTTQSCSAPSGYVSNNLDCNDNNPAVNPGVIEVCNGIDDNCNGQKDEGFPDTNQNGKADCVDPNSPPITEITAPEANSWHNGPFAVTLIDSDADDDTFTCEYSVWVKRPDRWDETTLSTPRTCNSAVIIDCPAEGYDYCEIHASATDKWGATGTTAMRLFSLDWTGPNIRIVKPLANAITGDKRQQIETAINDRGVGLDMTSARLYVDGTKVAPVVTATDIKFTPASVKYTPTTDLAEGKHNLKVQMNDTLRNPSTLEWQFTVDTTKPAVNILAPTIFDKITRTQKVIVETNEMVKKIRGSTATGRTFTLCTNCDLTGNTLVFDEGTNTLTVTAEDYAGNPGTAAVSFFIDSHPPQIQKTLPDNGVTIQGSVFTVRYTEDNLKKVILHWRVYSPLGPEQTTEFTGCTSGRNQECSNEVSMKAQDGKTIQYWFELQDGVNTPVLSSKKLVNIDSTKPVITISSPTVSLFNKASVNLGISLSEAASLAYTDNGRTVNLCTFCDGFNGARSFSDGEHKLTFKSTDKAGNPADEKTVTFTIDTTKPVIISVSPTNGYTAGTFEVQYTATDLATAILHYGSSQMEQPCTKGTSQTCKFSPPVTNGNSFDYYFELKDTAGNIATSSKKRVTVDTVKPTFPVASLTPSRGGIDFKILLSEKVSKLSYNAGAGDKLLCVGCNAYNIKQSFAPGTYTITLKAEDFAGNSNTKIETVTVT